MTFAEALAEGRADLEREVAESAALDARVLLADAAGLDMAGLISRSRDTLPEVAQTAYASHIKRRVAREPIARILGEAEFWGLPFKVNAATLIPRPDTETLVEAVLEEARRMPPDLTICDLGTGSGAVAIALLRELPRGRAVATDISDEALEMARENAERLGVLSRLRVQKVDFADGPEGPFDVVVANPPYVRTDVIATLEREVRDYDPRAALDGGPDGLAAYRVILAQARNLMGKNGILALETGHDQSDAVSALCRGSGLGSLTIRKDLSGNGRVVAARAAGSESDRQARKKALGNVG